MLAMCSVLYVCACVCRDRSKLVLRATSVDLAACPFYLSCYLSVQSPHKVVRPLTVSICNWIFLRDQGEIELVVFNSILRPAQYKIIRQVKDYIFSLYKPLLMLLIVVTFLFLLRKLATGVLFCWHQLRSILVG